MVAAILRGVMDYANLRSDWEFVMPPIVLADFPANGLASGRTGSWR